jgi:NAD(P)-dependent dehydrogenase (short-subunit alcohol dehydrogenase family)
MNKKICLITGATAGIGKETAKQLAAKNIHVVITARSKNKAEDTISDIKRTVTGASLDYLLCDLSSQKSVRQLAEEFQSSYDRLDILINNAGAVYSDLHYSKDGIEMQFAVNHLAHFLLTNLLLGVLKKSAPSRIINVSSDSHYRGKINFDDLYHTKRYWVMTVYEQSKLANVLFTYELDRMLEDTGVTVNALHPGMVDTTIGNTHAKGIASLGWSVMRLFAITVEKGAATTVYLATSDEVKNVSGKYFAKGKPKKSSRASYDKETALMLWNVSKELTGLS